MLLNHISVLYENLFILISLKFFLIAESKISLIDMYLFKLSFCNIGKCYDLDNTTNNYLYLLEPWIGNTPPNGVDILIKALHYT